MALGPAAVPFLREQMAAEEWRSQLAAEVLLGWLEQPQVYGLVLEDVTAF